MKSFKTRSLNPAYSDKDIERGCRVVGFASFERAVRLIESEDRRFNSNELLIGYSVTEDGIELIYE